MRLTKLRFIGLAGAAATIEQEGFRFRNDDGSESAATWRQTQDVDDTIAKDTNFRLRFLLSATGDPVTSKFQVEYKETSAEDTRWRKIPLT